MDSSVDIIEVLSYGKYRLNEHELQSIVSKAEECNDFAVISIIGEKYSGKTLFMNSLVNYLECEEKEIWPKDCVIEYRSGFLKRSDKKPVIQMWSKPFILEVYGHKTAVFLIDTSHVFLSNRDSLSTKVAQDLVGLLFASSSTVIYNLRNLITGIFGLTDLTKTVKTFVDNSKPFQELFYLIHGCELAPDTTGQDYSFGIVSQSYVQDQPECRELNKYFKIIDCCLLPSTGRAINKFNVVFNDFEEEFLIHFSEMIKNRVLNIFEMQVKRHPVSQRTLKPQELIPLLRSYVNKLNGDSVSIDCGLSDEINVSIEEPNEEPNEEPLKDNSISKPNTLETLSSQVLQNLLREKQNDLIKHMNAMKTTTEEILEINKVIIKHNSNNCNQDQSKEILFDNTSIEQMSIRAHNQNGRDRTYTSDVNSQTNSSNEHYFSGHQSRESEVSLQSMDVQQNATDLIEPSEKYSNKTIDISSDDSFEKIANPSDEDSENTILYYK